MYKSIKLLDNTEKSKLIMGKLEKDTLPILVKRQWIVNSLKEFCPSDESLQGTNLNNNICVRFKRFDYKDIYLEYNYILGTLLHELCHIVHANHDTLFYKLLDELHNEVEESDFVKKFNKVEIGTKGIKTKIFKKLGGRRYPNTHGNLFIESYEKRHNKKC